MGPLTILLMLCMGLVLHNGCAFITRGNAIPVAIPDPAALCTIIKFTDPKRYTTTRESVLRELCKVGVSHVDFDDTRKQFAVYNIHRDSFESKPRWHSGDAQNVMDDKYWEVNEVIQLQSSKHHWYSHGLPIWPLPHQALSNGTNPKVLPLSKKKPVDWPNYGIATPIYFAAKAWRNQAWSAEEFFQQTSKTAPFKSLKDFHKLAKALVENIDGQQVESYSEWPFLKHSLGPMVNSVVNRNKGLCPDEMFLYFHVTPCYPKEAQFQSCNQAALAARNLLTQANCRTTDVIVGYTQEYNNNAL
ncbi:hypothetical protein SK128_000946 [Halocaridina rubra]|uniref:Uncharacterized protein n=1 Tax=Halocaridina rubra TaxID=373956 RepID=A0AAN8X7G1_HALRR